MAFKMKGFSAFTKTNNSAFTKTSAFKEGVTSDLIVQGQGESNEDYQKRRAAFVTWLQENAGPGMNAEKAQNFANQSNSRFDSPDPNTPKSKEQKSKELERIEISERGQV